MSLSTYVQELTEGKIVCVHFVLISLGFPGICLYDFAADLPQDFAGQALVENIARLVLIGTTVSLILSCLALALAGYYFVGSML